MKRNDVRWVDTPLEHTIAFFIFIAAFAVLFPWGLKYSTEVIHLTDDQIIAPDPAREEMAKLLGRIDEPGFTPAVAHHVIKRAAYIERHTPRVPKALLDSAEWGTQEYRELGWKRERISYIWSQIALNAREKFRADPVASEELFKLERGDAELQALYDFRPVTTTYHWDVIGQNFRAKLPFSFVLAFLFFIAMIKARELNLAVELANPLSLIFATATFPVSWLVYPYKDPDQQVSKVVNVVGLAFSLIMTFSGMGVAQTVKKSEKKRQKISLQIDSRAMFPLGDDPKDTILFNRATLDLGKGVVENISLAKPSTGFWYSEMCGGPWLGKIAKTAILAVGCVAKAKEAKLGWAAGIQVYRPFGKRFFLAVPVLRMDGKTFGFLGALSAKLGKGWSLVPELDFKLAVGKRPQKGGGIVLRRSFGSGSAEAGVLRNGAGKPILRPRFIQNLAF